MPLHADLTGADLHEPKGVASASANKVYVSNGSGSGTWSPLVYILNVRIADISIASTTYITLPYAGNIVKINSVIEGAITGSDEVVTAYNSSGSSMGTITISAVGSAGGDVDTLSPSSNNSFSANTALRLTSTGASATAQAAVFTITVERT